MCLCYTKYSKCIYISRYLSSTFSDLSTALKNNSRIYFAYPGTCLDSGQCSFTIVGPSIWNSLPPKVTLLPTVTETIYCTILKIDLFQSVDVFWMYSIDWPQCRLFCKDSLYLSCAQLFYWHNLSLWTENLPSPICLHLLMSAQLQWALLNFVKKALSN